MAVEYKYEISWERMIRAVELVRERCNRAVKALEGAGISYAVVGGHAVAAWVSRVDEDAVRNTNDVDILVRRSDLEAIKAAMEPAGFVFANAMGVDLFLDGPDGKPSRGVHLLYAGEKVKLSDAAFAPDITESEPSAKFRVVKLEALVRMKLVANRDKDRTHIRDLIGVGMIDDTWPSRYPPVLAERLLSILDNPDG
jgi:hypothetical protein